MSEKSLVTLDDSPAQMGSEFVVRFYRIFKGAQIYEQNNAMMDQYVQEALPAINSIIQSEGYLFFKIVRDSGYLNNVKIPVRADTYSICKGLLNELKKRWIGEIGFTEFINEEQLKEFAFLLLGLEENNENNYIYVKQHLEHQGIKGIEVSKLELFKDEEIYIDPEYRKQNSKEIYFKLIHLVKEMMENLQGQRLVNIRKIKRLMQNTVNAIIRDDSILLGLANLKNYDEYTFNHSVNVAIYAIALGQRIGIPKKHLFYLGMAGLFHDIGKIKIPKKIINKEGKLTSEEWQVIRSHPVIGAEIVMMMEEWGELSTRMIDSAFEHHLRYDLSGYPKLSQKRKISLFSRIIALADFYDALVRPRVYHRFPYVSEKILGLMMERRGKDFDPILVKVFINMIGVFPLGALVLLNTSEMGVVVQMQEDPAMIDRPKVNLIYYREGEYRKGESVDLTEKDEGTGEYKRNIIKTLDPNNYNINIAEFLI